MLIECGKSGGQSHALRGAAAAPDSRMLEQPSDFRIADDHASS
jgi:hypothetical protein